MNKKRIPGFQWAMMIFIFFIISYALPIILKDFQNTVPFKTFVFDMSFLAPFIATILCIIVFKHRTTQLGSLKFTFSLKVIERILLALILPLVIFIIAMASFNVFADSYVLLQSEDLSVSIVSIILGQLIMAFLVELGFRSYLQHIVETKMNTLFASILVGIMYAIWSINISFSFEYTLYNFLYYFAFSMIIGELIRATKGRTIYIATIFHAAMSFGLVFLFNEELGYVFSMKVIALSTTVVAVIYIVLSFIIRGIFYFFTKRNLDEVDENNYLDHVNEDSENDNAAAQPYTNADDKSQKSESATTQHDKQDDDAPVNHDSPQQHDSQHTKESHANQQSDYSSTAHTSPVDEQDLEHRHDDSIKDDSRANIISQPTSDDTVDSNQTTEVDSKPKRYSPVEASTEKAHTDASKDTQDETITKKKRYGSNRKSSAVKNAKASITEDHEQDSTESQQTTQNEKSNDDQNKSAHRSPFKLKSKRGHRR
ncbi:CPBP family intramembrane glutamic endopeptidase [Staphylococcus casei]|uniref:CPBP family glutamic-type intramembrane protease n=1 Tax=Staphylococcus casei TaxID=201828 RepID=A0ABZ2W965_9STAP|nr:lysostaphin resistance protein A [Staphylococcus succinus]PTI40139.1 lysostaphin resistance protein A [Staphylococcus succinus]